MNITRRSLFSAVFAAPIALKALSVVPASNALVAPRALDQALRVSPKISKEIIEDALRLLGIMLPGQCASRDEIDYCGRVAERLFWNWPAPNNPYSVRLMIRALARDLAPTYRIDLRG